jgi:CHASE3 domain sensor protein
VIAKGYELQKTIVDQETGLRGYLLTANREFLEPFERARPLDTLAELAVLVEDNTQQRAYVAELRRRYELWLSSASSAINGNIEDARALGTMRSRKRSMDDIRVSAEAVLEAERSLRDERAKNLSTSNELTRLILVGLLALAAAAIALVSRRNMAAVAEVFDDALRAERKTRAEV